MKVLHISHFFILISVPFSKSHIVIFMAPYLKLVKVADEQIILGYNPNLNLLRFSVLNIIKIISSYLTFALFFFVRVGSVCRPSRTQTLLSRSRLCSAPGSRTGWTWMRSPELLLQFLTCPPGAPIANKGHLVLVYFS